MASNRPYSTLHSPEEPQIQPLHTPVEPETHNPFRSTPPNSQESGEAMPQTPLYYTQQHPATSLSSHPSAQIAPLPQIDQAMSTSNFAHPAHAQGLSPHSTGTISAHSTGSPHPNPTIAVTPVVPSAHSSPPGSPGLPPLPGHETYMMTPQVAYPAQTPPPTFEQYQAQNPSQQPNSPPPAFNPLDPNPYDQTQRQQFPMPPEPIHTPSYNPSDASTGPVTPKTPVYTPAAASGPNGGVHAPGQIGHPNQQHGVEEYHHGLCDCYSNIGTCCTGYWCPCILYSRTYHRLKTVPNSNLNEFSSCNSHCAMFCLLAPVSFILSTLQRSRIRENYRLQGSVANDCVKAYCCVSCVLIQDDREVAHREDERRRFAGPGSGVVGDGGYRRQPTMSYP